MLPSVHLEPRVEEARERTAVRAELLEELVQLGLGEPVGAQARAGAAALDGIVRSPGRARKPREVRPAGIDLGFGEVRVHGERRERSGAESLRRVQAHIGVPFGRRVRRWFAGARRDGGAHAQPDPEVEGGKTGEQPGAADMGDPIVALRAHPAVGFLEALYAALDVEPPPTSLVGTEDS